MEKGSDIIDRMKTEWSAAPELENGGPPPATAFTLVR
jgi:hypothetical protein